MSLGVRARVFLATLALAVVIGLPAGILLEVRLRTMQIDNVEQRLARDAEALAVHLRADPQGSTQDDLVDELAAALDVRLTLIDATGRVLGDSERDGDALDALENHATRPEVAAATAVGRGSATRLSDTLGEDMLYVAAQHDIGGHRMVTRAATPLREVDSLIWQLRATLLLGGGLALVLAAASGGLLSSWTLGTLSRLVERAHALQGERPAPAPEADGDDDDDDGGAGADGTSSPGAGLGRSTARPSMLDLTTELDRVVHDLASERDRLGAVLDAVTDKVIAVDAELRISAANPPAREMLGRRKVLGRRLAKLAPSSALVDLAVAARGAGEPVIAEVSWGDPLREHHVTAAPLASLGGCVLVLHDLTEVRALERVRRDFVANVSHELRTPVSIIAAMTETLMDGAIDDPAMSRDFTAAIRRNATRLGSLVDDLLSLSRMEAGRFPVEPAALDLVAAAGRVAKAAVEKRPERTRPVEVEVPEGLQVWADRAGLDHVLTNLVENAVSYTNVDDRIAIRARATKRWVLIEVLDEGPGIDEPHRDRIFERFYRVDAGRSRNAGGTGLGLAIARHLASLMDGSVELSANEPRGCVFTLRLPRVRPEV